MLTLDQIKENGWLVFEVITGSRAYGLDTAKSDTDIRGVFVLPKDMFYSLEYIPQVANETNDIVYYELRRFIELLSKNNPNLLELLNVPENCVLNKHPIMNVIKQEMFLSKLCEKTFANYAFAQIKKAYGLEKKIVSPVEETRKSVLDFCFVYVGKDAIPFERFITQSGFAEEEMGLSAITHIKGCYNLYHSREIKYDGVARNKNANDVSLSSIPKGEEPVGMLYFNKDGYSVYCKQYKEYWDWVAKRKADRYNTTITHGKKYDAKNMMHVFRLLFMAKEIAGEGKINVFRNDREFLLDIKQGKYEYEELVEKAEAMKEELPLLFQNSNLPDEPLIDEVNKLLIKMREEYYLHFSKAQ
jgi:predicted nucleotidyltransferase